MLVLGQVRLSKGKLYPAELEKGLRKAPAGLEPPPPYGARNKKKTSLLIFNNPRSRQGSLRATFNRELHLLQIFCYYLFICVEGTVCIKDEYK